MSLAITAGSGSTSTYVTLEDIKERLNKVLTVDDDELTEMAAAALSEYERHVGPVPGTITERFTGEGPFVLSSPTASALVSAIYSDGAALDIDSLDLDVRTGIVSWAYGYAPTSYYGLYLTISYTVASLPQSHVEAIIADVAGYFEKTQTGPVGPVDDGYSDAYTATPTILFPRIRALAPPRVA